jgi:hypothetical protein
MKQPIALSALILFIAGVSFVLSAQDQPGGRPITTTLNGAAEVPGPGDTDGTGTFTATFNPGKGQVCYELTVDKIATATAAHIHVGGEKESGPVVVALKAPAEGSAKDCATVEREKLTEMMKRPAGYYVNVHNAEFPDGAIRGQLAK